ncbi:hypothetical protein BG011_003866 [Mortierella polycephala]|uniref:Uncharacterized protein n=1 Tax=Mortierella polycephala TaxID=41804 RepID=A0A9P6PZW3_9FUNG|nr:hypothetical protein BG011_003866 [Mortierella polycephala]
MEWTTPCPEYKLVFLNELHERLKRLDPQRMHNAGLYRILGRLVEYDIENQIAKIESCFHIDFSPPVVDACGERVNTTKLPSACDATDRTEETRQTSDDMAAQSNCIDLTITTDEDSSGENETSISADRRNKGKAVKRDDLHIHLQNGQQQQQQRRRPKVILWIDTKLINPWNYQRSGLYQFMGEVVFENGHWVLQARTIRDMDGLDLYSYRQAILLTRKLMKNKRLQIENKDA